MGTKPKRSSAACSPPAPSPVRCTTCGAQCAWVSVTSATCSNASVGVKLKSMVVVVPGLMTNGAASTAKGVAGAVWGITAEKASSFVIRSSACEGRFSSTSPKSRVVSLNITQGGSVGSGFGAAQLHARSSRGRKRTTPAYLVPRRAT